MQKYNFDSALDTLEKEGVVNKDDRGSWYKLVEGKNRVRVLTPLFAYQSHFKAGACVGKEHCPECKKVVKVKQKDGTEMDRPNTPTVKFLCHVLDYSDPILNNGQVIGYQIKLAQFPLTVFLALRDLQNDPDWAFDELPMPYDITINAEGAGKKEVKYSVIASPKMEPVSQEVIDKLSKTHTPDQVKEAMVNKQRKVLGLERDVQGSAVPYPSNENAPNGEDVPF